MILLSDWKEIGGFCVIEWILESESAIEFIWRIFVFFTIGIFVVTALNIAWLLYKLVMLVVFGLDGGMDE